MERGRFTFSDFRLQSGEVLLEVTIAWRTRGKLAPDGRNAILVTHGYTSGPQMIEPEGTSSEGAWTTLIGPGAPIDTDRNYVVASNMLGSSFGSTNAASVDPRTGRRYGPRFPAITVADIVAAQHRLLQHLGVTHLRAVTGPSYGGFQAFQWAVSFPDFMDAIVPVVSAPAARLNVAADAQARLQRDPNWNGGDYYDTGGVFGTMVALRMDTLRRYGMTDEAAIRRAAEQWARVFDANSLLILGRATEGFDLTAQLGRIRVPVLYVLSRTDVLFPPARASGVMQALRAAGVDATYFEIDSEKGHLASGADADKWAPALRTFMRRSGAGA